MNAFLDYVVKGLVDRPDAVQLTSVEKNGLTVYELRVHPTDMGKIIGRQGATINAIRALLLVGSAKKGLRCALEVIDEEGSSADRPPRAERPPRSFDRDRGRGGGGGGGSRGGGRDRGSRDRRPPGRDRGSSGGYAPREGGGSGGYSQGGGSSSSNSSRGTGGGGGGYSRDYEEPPRRDEI